jgi:hypothetical protein
MIGVKAATIVGLDDFQPLRVEGLERKIVPIEVVENAEFHSSSLLLLSLDRDRPSSLKALAPTRSRRSDLQQVAWRR